MTVTDPAYDAMYGSKYLSAADLNGETRRAKIGKVTVEVFKEKDGQSKRKALLHLVGEDKLMVVNKTNAGYLSKAFGKSFANWENQHIELYTETTQFGDGVRVRPLRKPATPDRLDPDLDDCIGF
jgi:hypothetical protein